MTNDASDTCKHGAKNDTTASTGSSRQSISAILTKKERSDLLKLDMSQFTGSEPESGIDSGNDRRSQEQ